MEALSADAMHCVLEKLDFVDLLAASSACRLLHTAAAPGSALWRDLCTRRWHSSLNTALWLLPQQHNQQQQQQQPRTNYKALFTRDNGWSMPRLAMQRYAGSSWADELVAVQPSTAADGTTTVAVSSCRELRILELGSCSTAQLQVRHAASIRQHSAGEQWSSVAALPAAAGGSEGLVAAGGSYGRLALFKLPEARSSSPSMHAAKPAATLVFPENNCIISQLHLMPVQQRLAVLHDPLALLRPTAQRSRLSVVDAASWHQVVPSMSDVLEGYELAAVAPVGNSGNELMAGSVRLSDNQASGWPCQRCFAVAPASLCFHKSSPSTAVLCMFDLRAPLPMVARYSTHHRSLYPHLELTREHFLLTSHAGLPGAVWDRRQMNGPVHEVQPLPRELDGGRAAAAGWLAMEHPELHEQPANQALHLSATSDMLLGRADNGMCWLWDLSERLGWQDGSHVGSWLCRQQLAGGSKREVAGGQQQGSTAADGAALGGADLEMRGPAGDEGHEDEHDFERAPLPLGCIRTPYEAWCSNDGEAAPLHWLPLPAAWVAHNRLVALGGLELEDKQVLFPAHGQGSPYPSNTLVVASLCGEIE